MRSLFDPWHPLQRARRLAVLVVSTFANAGELAASRIRPPRWEIRGSCSRCGVCCHTVLLKMPDWAVRYRPLLGLIVSFTHLLTDLRFKHEVTHSGYFLFTCDLFLPDGSCGDYRLRPWICRRYPRVSYFDKPEVLPECSYFPALRGRAASFEEALRRQLDGAATAAAPPRHPD
ncbi:MAG: YkgJ family cysteine cluster protein [Candidatus Schekmanbacteria bacterium]|nr:YkgJ family cysteine cluster protein [Candidatus Schekmanbacteria bacterium]